MYSFSALLSIKKALCSPAQNVIYAFRFSDNSIIDNSILNKHKICFDTVSNQEVFNQVLP